LCRQLINLDNTRKNIYKKFNFYKSIARKNVLFQKDQGCPGT
jgi:hypothetical protein